MQLLLLVSWELLVKILLLLDIFIFCGISFFANEIEPLMLCTDVPSLLISSNFYLLSLDLVQCSISNFCICSIRSCKLGESKIILCDEGSKHKLQKLQLNYPRSAFENSIKNFFFSKVLKTF